MTLSPKEFIEKKFERLICKEIVGANAICVCQCGKTNIIVPKKRLRNKTTRSCGCLRQEVAKKKATKHGKSKDRLYTRWLTLRSRINNPNFPKYKNYGGRGIKISPLFDDFEYFSNYCYSLYPNLGELLDKKFEIDREDNDGHYEPGNIRFISGKDNSNNRTNNLWLIVKGETITAAQAEAKYKIVNQHIIANRVHKGYSYEEAVLVLPLPQMGSRSFSQWKKFHSLNTIEEINNFIIKSKP